MKKGVKPLITGLVLLVLGVILFPVAIAIPIILNQAEELQFLAPGVLDVNVEKPGRYYLWNQYKTFFEGKNYNRSVALPDGFEISVQNHYGSELDFFPDLTTTVTSGKSSKNSIGYVHVDSPVILRIKVSGRMESRVFSFSQSNMGRIFGCILSGVFVSLILVIVGLVISIRAMVAQPNESRKVKLATS